MNKMSHDEIELLQRELLLRGINMAIPASVYHMDIDKALSVCLDLYAGFTFRQAIDSYDKDTI